MTYKIFTTNSAGETIYARVDADGLIRVTCSAENPEFQEWLAEGNEPLPADN